MEAPVLQSQASMCCRRPPSAPLKIRTLHGPFTQYSLCHRGIVSVRFAPRMTSSSEYPRRRPKKSLIPKTNAPSPKGFAPRIQVGTEIRKKDQIDNAEEREGTSGYGVREQKSGFMSGSLTKKQADVLDELEEDTADFEDSIDGALSGDHSVVIQRSEGPSVGASDVAVIGGVDINPKGIGSDVMVEPEAEVDEVQYNAFSSRFKDSDVSVDQGSSLKDDKSVEEDTTRDEKYARYILAKQKEEEYALAKQKEEEAALAKQKEEEDAFSSRFKDSDVSVDQGSSVEDDKSVKEDTPHDGKYAEYILAKQKEEEYALAKQKEEEAALAKQKEEEDAQAKRKAIEELAEQNVLKGSKMFVYPDPVKANQVTEVYFNRSGSVLVGESDVLILGAFNGWRWNSFTEKLLKSDLPGDWWSCQLYVPKEAYQVDFVFFNGGSVYENNDLKDFCIAVDGGMDSFTFEDFLLEEKRRELEKLAAEQAEREREAEEQRRREAEIAAREADRAQAKLEAERKRSKLQPVLNAATNPVDNLYYMNPEVFKDGDRIRIFFNRSSSSLAHAGELWIHGGHNNWSEGLSIVEKLFSFDKEGGDWWYADVVVPQRALLLDWVFADGPPQKAKVYDNNNHQDFHAIVPSGISDQIYWAEEENMIFNKLQGDRRMEEEAIRRKSEKTQQMKAQMRKKTMEMFLLSQKHIFYTDPLDVQAGKPVTVFYNPSGTALSGKSDIWFRCSFNRWTHRNGTMPPQKMVPADGGSHVKASVKVPLDAYMMDFVFSDQEKGGTFDNKNGMDYHIPVSGGQSREPPMHIVHISVEMAPIAKDGGLGDVVTSLSRAVQELGHNVEIILPKYDCMNLSNVKDFHFSQSFGWQGCEIKVYFGKVEGLPVYFLEPHNGMFWAGCIYGCKNDGERFGFFCHAALEYLLKKGAHPDILHCHDWSSAPVAWLFKEQYMQYGLSNSRVVFTIHNLEFGAPLIGKAMLHADKATTVSKTYSKEVSGNPVIAPHYRKFYGIVNGIDPDIWDPYNDNFIPISYTSENVVEGKRAAKEALQQRLGLKKLDRPLVGIITRLTVQKGIHLIKHAIWRALERNGQVVLLGSAPDPRIQNDFVNLANQLHNSHGDRARLCLTYDEPLSHLIYAGADFILVPSIFEPCGLTQLIAMRYGAVPVVRKTGGLYDTVYDVDHDKERAEAQGLAPNGFSFDGADSRGVDYALNRAISAWYDGRDWFNSLCKRVMEQDWSWNRPALDYMELYHSARE